MNFLDIFTALNDRLVIGYLMSTTIFLIRPNLCLWQLFKEGKKFWPILHFQTPITLAWSRLFGHFQRSK